MSIRVSGITLRVEGAEQFASQLDTANKAMRRNAAEMKLLEATYANSQNSDYFGKQSELLTKQLEEQRKKTATLQQARDAYAQTPGADASKLEQLDLKILKSQTDEAKLTAEIQKCNAAMQKAQEQQQALGDATEETGQAADDAASAQANLAESTSEAGNQQRSAAENAKHYGEALDKLAKGATQAGKALTKVLTLPIVGMGTASVKYGMELEDAVYEVATLPGVLSGTQEQRQQQIRDLTDELIDASNDAHTAATELASATYDAISAGVAPEDAAYWAERAAMAGKAGRSDASTVINGASSIYNAWGAKASGGLESHSGQHDNGAELGQNDGRRAVLADWSGVRSCAAVELVDGGSAVECRGADGRRLVYFQCHHGLARCVVCCYQADIRSGRNGKGTGHRLLCRRTESEGVYRLLGRNRFGDRRRFGEAGQAVRQRRRLERRHDAWHNGGGQVSQHFGGNDQCIRHTGCSV